MRQFLIAIAAPALLMTAIPAAAETQQQPRARDNSAQQQQQRGRDSADPDRRICVTERLSGSRMPRRVCRTPSEWQTLQDGTDDPRL